MRLPTLIVPIVLLMTALAPAADIPRPEHPRPDLMRENWQNLNGPWQFAEDPKGEGDLLGWTGGKKLDGTITVPFAFESKLSGIDAGNDRYVKDVWYRRLVDVPASMSGKRVLLHIGAADYRTWVYVNGELAGEHTGGSAPFAVEVTRFLTEDKPLEIVVHCFDDLRSGKQPGGKQAPGKVQGIFYKRTTGIWQTVWLEAVGQEYVKTLTVRADPAQSAAVITAAIDGLDPELSITYEASAGGKPMGTATAEGLAAAGPVVLKLDEVHLWQPGKPFLYDLKVTLKRGGKVVDELNSYFGLRTVSIVGRQILINGKPVFQRTVLDQGFYPDGGWTAPSDAALKHDIEMSMAVGFNGARLHQKVFEPRFLYWADKLGYLVWGEYPNWGHSYQLADAGPFISEWTEVLLRDRSHPAIIGWCPFNETGDRAAELQKVIFDVTRAVDSSRPVIESSGWSHTVPNPMVLDRHDYEHDAAKLAAKWHDFFTAGPPKLAMPPRYGTTGGEPADAGVPYWISEMGGIGWSSEKRTLYGSMPESLDAFYKEFDGVVGALMDNPNFFGFCYTQLTDVEEEKNGIYYFDRTPKFDPARLRAALTRPAAYESGKGMAPPPKPPAGASDWTVLIGALPDAAGQGPWRYATETPGDDWAKADFDDTAWKSAPGPFGDGDPPTARTPWTSDDLYLRRTVELDPAKVDRLALVIRHDDGATAYLNGVKIYDHDGPINDFRMTDVTDAARKAMRPGKNVLAVHVHENGGGQYSDAALLALEK